MCALSLLWTRQRTILIMRGIALALRKRSKQVIGNHSFKCWPRTPAFQILLFIIFLSPQDKLFCKSWPLPSTSFAIHYLSVIFWTIYSVKYQQRTEVCICTCFAASLNPYGTMETFCVTAISLGVLVCLFVFGAAAPSGPGPPHSRGFLITHTHTRRTAVGRT
jgi:hypothetical protein